MTILEPGDDRRTMGLGDVQAGLQLTLTKYRRSFQASFE